MSHYTVLGIGKDFTSVEIRRAYRGLCLECHPDRNPGDPAAEERFKQVAVAYQVLSDPQKRKHYDLSSTWGGAFTGSPGAPEFNGNVQHDIQSVVDMFSDFLETSPLFEDARQNADREAARKKTAAKKKAPKKKAAKKKAPRRAAPKCSACHDSKFRTVRQGTAEFKIPCGSC